MKLTLPISSHSSEAEWLTWLKTLSDPEPALKVFARQYHYFSLKQVIAFSGIFDSIPIADRESLSTLGKVLFDELGEGQAHQAHSALLENFTKALGILEGELPIPESEVLPAVQAYLNELEHCFRSKSLQKALAAYHFLEQSAVQTYRPIFDFLLTKYQEDTLKFFELHAELEPQHEETAKVLVAKYIPEGSDAWTEYRLSFEKLAKLWNNFWVDIRLASENDIGIPASLKQSWSDNPVYQELCDLVASDKLVCLTGAGISLQLRRSGSSKTLPTWKILLSELFEHLKNDLSDQNKIDAEQLIFQDSPPGSSLILAASILQKANPDRFAIEFRKAIEQEPNSTTPVHEAIWQLYPRGIITFNYDKAHENAAKSQDYDFLLPKSDQKLGEVISNKFSKKFLLKAHGSVEDGQELILTRESYRNILVEAPAYRAFVQNILTNFNLLIIGFGLSDPDFDLFINTIACQFGSPLQKHIAIFKDKLPTAREIELKRCFGIHILYIDDYNEIPELLNSLTQLAGPRLNTTINKCFNVSREIRSIGHDELLELGFAGKQCANSVFNKHLEAGKSSKDAFVIAEAAYSLGKLDANRNKALLVDIIENSTYVDPIARALTVVRSVMTPDDLKCLDSCRRRLNQGVLQGENPARLKIYLDYLEEYVNAKFKS